MLKSADVNDACTTLLESESRCPYFRAELFESRSDFFVDNIGKESWSNVEDLRREGLRLSVCPYFASRSLIDNADLVLLPYNYLLQPKIRESLNLVMDGSIIIFDEAHNLPGFILDANTHAINRFDRKLGYLLNYLESFNRLCSFSSEIYTKELRSVISRIILFLQRHAEGNRSAVKEESVRMTAFVQELGISNINFQEICMKLSRIRIYDRFIAHSTRIDSETYAESDKDALKTFLPIWGVATKDSIFLIFRFKDGQIDLKLIDYDASSQITAIANASRAMIFSSGTIFPTSSFRNRLLCRTAKEFGEISCSHVIDPKQASVLILPTIASAKMDFRFSNRDNFPALFEQIGHQILCVCQSASFEGGIVVFVPSYQVLGNWHQIGHEYLPV